MTVSRRTLLSAAGAGLVGAAGGTRWLADPAAALPAPAASGIEHIVVLMMENRSFDHFLGWLPGADGRQAGLRYEDRYGRWHPTHHLMSFSSCSHADPDHSYEGGRIEFNRGRCDGFLKAGQNDLFSIGYYGKADLPFLGRAATDFTTCSRYFAATMAETYPNRFYQHAAQTDRMHNSTAICSLPTIWDRLRAKNVSAKYYFGDLPFLALWGNKYADLSAPYATFLADAAAGTLPAVSFVDPTFAGEGNGTSEDDHPYSDIRAGETFMNQVYDAVRRGPGWANTLLVVNFDEWGGFFEHIPPSIAPDNNPKYGLRGFRVPALLISPFARRRHIATATYDHTSVLKMIEWRHGLAPLTKRDAAARNIAEVLDFAHPVLATPTYQVPTVTGTPCPGTPTTPTPRSPATGLRDLALAHGFQVK